jgi:hypothetical protein
MADHRSAPIEAFIVGLSSGWNYFAIHPTLDAALLALSVGDGTS